jgi:chloride channel protein, CIC family
MVGAFAVVGMGAVFAGIVRAPMTSILIIYEMTRGYGLVLPMMIANMSAYALARHWRRTPIYEALLEQDGIVLERDVDATEDGGRSGQHARAEEEMGVESRD